MNVYLASSWRNTQQPAVLAAIREAGHDVYDFRNPAPGDKGFHWTECDPEWRRWDASTYRGVIQTHPVAQDGYNKDFLAMQAADVGVLLLPCGRSAHLEAGWFAGAKKPLYILLDESPEPELMYNMASSICLTLPELLEALAVLQKRL